MSDTKEQFENYLAEKNGQIEALSLVCSTLISLSPHKNQISALLQKLTQHTKHDVGGKNQEAYSEGIRKVVANIQLGLKSSQDAEQINSLDPDSKQH
jgi:hypothetical protein